MPTDHEAAATESAGSGVPRMRQVVLDTTDARGLAEFYREFLDLRYVPGDEAPPPGEPDPHGADWLVLENSGGRRLLAFQQVRALPEATWPEGPRPQMLHLDMSVPSVADLARADDRAQALGARVLQDRRDDDAEPLVVFADLAGHPFCVFVAPAD